MNYKKYLDLIVNGKKDEAIKYKSSTMPSRLFKYVSLREGDIEKNEKKFATLERLELHLDSLERYNDPFEGTFLLIDEKKLESHGWEKGFVTDFYKNIINSFKICCLSATTEQNMPMWAYYANNHEGYCIEYAMTEQQRKYIFPVVYEKKRSEATSMISNLLTRMIQLMNSNKSYFDEPEKMYEMESCITANLLLFLSMTAKHTSWRHEREYRIISPVGSVDSFPAIPLKIFIGMNCKDEHVERICQIVERINHECKLTEVYKMKFDQSSTSFQLKKEKLI